MEIPAHTQRCRTERSLTVNWKILVAILFPADIGTNHTLSARIAMAPQRLFPRSLLADLHGGHRVLSAPPSHGTHCLARSAALVITRGASAVWATAHSVLNALFIVLFYLGVSPDKLHRWYYRTRFDRLKDCEPAADRFAGPVS